MSKPNFVTLIAPTFLAPFFVNGDAGDMSDCEVNFATEFLEANNVGFCVGVDEDEGHFMRFHDATKWFGACNCSEYTFQLIK